MSANVPVGAKGYDRPPQWDEMNAMLARHWWTIVLRGVFGVIFGVIALFAPGAILFSLAFLFGIYLLADGLIGLAGTVRSVSAHGPWGGLLAEAVLNILMGLIALFVPSAAIVAFVLMMAAWAFLSGGLMTAAAIRLHLSHGRLWLALGGIASIIWGLLLIIAPMMGAVVLAWWLGIYAIIFGVSLLVCGWHLRGQQPA